MIADIITENLYQCKLAKPKIITSSFCDLCQFTFCIQYDSRRGAASGNEQNEPDDGCVAGAGLRGRGELFNAHGSLFIAAHTALLVLLALLGGSGRAVDLPYELVRLDILLVMADGALLIVAVLVVAVLVVMLNCDALGLGLAANGAGVLHRTWGDTGAGIGDNALVPFVCFNVLLVMADGAFLIVIILVVSILVVVIALEIVAVFRAAYGACVFNDTGDKAGRFLSDNAVIPFVSFNVLLIMADGAFLIVAVVVVGVLVVMVAGDAFGLGLAADGAGEFFDAGNHAGRLLSDNALVPLVGFNVLLVAADAALLIMIDGVMRVPVIVIARDAFGLCLTAGGAGVLHRTWGEAGAGVSHDTVVPCVREHPAEDGIALGAICPVAALVVLELRTDVFRFGDSASAYGAGGAEAGGIGVAAVVAGLHIAAVGAGAAAGLVFRIVVLLIQGQSAYAGCLVIAGGILTA